MASNKEKRDKHFPLFAHDNPFRRLFMPPRRFVESFVAKDQTVADLGCGPGFYTIALAECAGPGGKVYAVDSDEKAIRAVEKKAGERGIRSIETRVSSAGDLSFIKDGTVDFVLAHGLLCSMAPCERDSAVSEIKRILKPGGRAYISVARGPWSYVSRAEWGKILEGFRVERKGSQGFVIADRWAVVSLKNG
jgi:ubiquinone/menaquinone biosynthesis C-methylase UbiE